MNTHHIQSISQLLREFDLPTPSHPLIAFVDYGQVSQEVIESLEKGRKISLDFYKISFKDKFTGRIKYGQGYYDFEEGGLAFLKPKQVVFSPETPDDYYGCSLYFHPDFIRNYPLGNSISQFGFFSYDVSEALFLSETEKEIISALFHTIANELKNSIDHYSQDVLVSQIELLLNYSNRFYNRQFITRKAVNQDLINSLDKILADYFEGDALEHGVPSVHYICERLQLSQRYLSDMLRSLTGLNTRQYIQEKLLEQSKDLLSTTSLSVAEIAYKLGFEHPQSFSKLFKLRTSQSPLEFRHKFN